MTVLAWSEGEAAGPAVVLLHDWATDAAAQFADTPLVAALGARGHRVLAADLPGHGASHDVPVPAEGNPAAAAAEAVLADLETLRVDEAVVLGAGAGGFVAAHVAVLGSPRVRALAVVGCDDRSGLPAGAEVAGALRDPKAPMWSPDAADRVTAARRSGGDLEALARVAEATGWPAAPRLGALRLPSLVVVAAEDAEARQRAPRLAGLLHDAHLAVVPGASHETVASPRLADVVTAFLDAQLDAPAPARG